MNNCASSRTDSRRNSVSFNTLRRAVVVGIVVIAVVVFVGTSSLAVDYYLPYPAGDGGNYTVTRTTGYPGGHTGQSTNAMDFYMPLGSLVVAAADGRVLLVQEEFEECGDEELMNSDTPRV